LAEQAGADATRPIARSPRRSPWVRSWCSTTRSIDEIAPRKRKPLALAGASGAVSRYHPASPRPRGSRPHALGTHRVRPGNGGHRRRLPRAEPRGSGRSSEAFFPSSNGPPFHHPRLAGPLPLGTLLFAAFAALRCPLGAYTSPALLSSTTCRLPLALRGPRTWLSTPTPLPEELAGRAPPGMTERGPPAVGEGTATHRFGLRVTWLVALLAGRTRQRTLSSATPPSKAEPTAAQPSGG
jgi:hypothetical protein